MASSKIGVIGLGLLGSALVERLLGAGFSVLVHNRTREKAAPLLEMGAQWSDNPFSDCDRVLISLYTTEVVEQVLAQMEGGLRPGQIIIDTTTGDPEQTAALGARLAQRGIDYLECPVSGNSDQTRRREVMVIVAGKQDVYEANRDVFETFASSDSFVGPWGNGARMKLVTNLVLGLNRAVVAEAIGFAKSIGLGGKVSLDVLRRSVAYSGVMDTKGDKMVNAEFSPQAKLTQHLKDVRIILKEGGRGGAELPLSELHARLLEELEDAGFGAEDNCAIIRAFDPDLRKE
jgi:3-hydroxyisobutyrate dehydrogenase-like beta-hydroxyacid dehydrogenase